MLFYKPYGTRNERGASLAAMLTMSVIVGIITTSMMAMIMPSYRKIADMKNGNRVRALSEAGIDYVVEQLSSAKANGASSEWDPGDSDGATVTKTLDQSITNDPKAKVSVLVQSVANPPKSSMLFDPLLNVTRQNAYRQVIATATAGGTTRQIRCLLEPIFDARPESGKPKYPYAAFGIARFVFVGKAANNSYNTPPGKDPRVGADIGSLGKISQVHGGSSGLDRGIAEGGSHYEFPNPTSYYNQQFGIVGDQFNAKAVSSAEWMQMMGNKYSNGANTAYKPRMPGEQFYDSGSGKSKIEGSPDHNVFGLTNGIDTGIPLGNPSNPSATVPLNPNPNKVGYPSSGNDNAWTGGVSNTLNKVEYPQPDIPPAPSAPSGTFDLGNVVLKNGATLEINANAAKPTAPLGTVNGKKVQIPPGDYSMKSLTLSGGSKIDIPASTTSETNFYLQGASNSNTISVSNDSSINMTGISGTGVNTQGKNGVKNGAGTNQLAVNDPSNSSLDHIKEVSGSADNLHIYSNSSATMQLQGNMRMTIYAPYATINIGSTEDDGNVSSLSKDANYYGAVVASVINLMSSYSSGGGAYLHYDKKLRPADQPDYMDPYHPLSPFFTSSQGKIVGYRAVTWQEAVHPNPSNPTAASAWKY